MSDTNEDNFQSQAEFLAELEAEDAQGQGLPQAVTQAHPQSSSEVEETPSTETVQESVAAAPEVQEDVAPTPQPTTAPSEPQLPAELAAIAAREQAAFNLQEEAKQQLAAAQAAQAELDEAFKKNPLKAIEDRFGLKYEDLTMEAVRAPENQSGYEVRQLQEQIASMQKQMQEQQAELQRQQLEAQTKAYDAQVTEFLSTQKTEDGSPTFPLTTKLYGENTAAEIRAVQEAAVARGEQKPTISEVAASIERTVRNNLEKVLGQEAISQLLGAAQTTTPNRQVPASKPSGKATQTLGNSSAGKTIKSTNEDPYPEDFAALIAEAPEPVWKF